MNNKNKDFSVNTVGKVKKTEKSPKNLIKILVLIMGIILIFAFSFALVSQFKNIVSSISESTIGFVSKTVGTEMQRDEYGNINILFLGYGGADHRGGFLTDSMMVASRNPDIGEVIMFSIPRDLWVQNSLTQAQGRINSVFSQMYGKTKDIHEAASGFTLQMEEMLGMQIPYYATIDFSAFKEVIDTLGGIDIDVPESIYDPYYPADNMIDYQTFHIEAGPQHLDGTTALKYARSRYTTSDFSRSLRQQLIIEAVKDKLLDSGLSISNAQELYNHYVSYVNTNISFQEMLWTVQYLPQLGKFTSFGFTIECSLGNFKATKAACFLYNPSRDLFGGASIMLPMGATANNIKNYDQMQGFIDFILSNQAWLQENPSIEVINAIDKTYVRTKKLSGVAFAGQLASKLKRYGFWIESTKNAEITSTGTYILIQDGKEYPATIKALESFLPVTDIRIGTGNLVTDIDFSGNVIQYVEGANISLYLGEDYLDGTATFSGLVEKKFSYTL
ncbi:MAG: LCP family protein [Candidatus Absconditabacteria bacterium]|nr:LCP family protein [Candidatus Absconditabacteria bacterium]MDD3868640.1 LCP family protein [Candidatus Absconditabacteria bacterium]MDD4714160.1 LCP family protein [Candidatus Absconditabacteria bacterium]